MKDIYTWSRTSLESPIRGYGLIYVGLFTLFQELGLLVLIHFLFGLFVFFYWHCSTLRSADGTFSNFPQYLDDKNISLFQDFWKK